MDSLHKNRLWILVERLAGQRVIGSRWIYKKKPGIPSVKAARHKARVVAKGYS